MAKGHCRKDFQDFASSFCRAVFSEWAMHLFGLVRFWLMMRTLNLFFTAAVNACICKRLTRISCKGHGVCADSSPMMMVVVVIVVVVVAVPKLNGGWVPALCLPTFSATPTTNIPFEDRKDTLAVSVSRLGFNLVSGPDDDDDIRVGGTKTGYPARRWRLSTIAVANVTHIVTNCTNLYGTWRSDGVLVPSATGLDSSGVV